MSEHPAPGTARHERSDVDPRILWLGAPLLIACTVALALLVLWLYPFGTLDRTLRLPLPQYPQPRLQADPAADMARFHRREMQWLDSTGWVDRRRGIVHIPIDQAMQQVARQGIPGWPAVAPPPASPDDFAPQSSSGDPAQQQQSSADNPALPGDLAPSRAPASSHGAAP